MRLISIVSCILALCTSAHSKNIATDTSTKFQPDGDGPKPQKEKEEIPLMYCQSHNEIKESKFLFVAMKVGSNPDTQ